MLLLVLRVMSIDQFLNFDIIWNTLYLGRIFWEDKKKARNYLRANNESYNSLTKTYTLNKNAISVPIR